MRGSRRRTESQRRKAQNQQEGKEVQDNKAEEQRLSEEQSEHLMLDNHYKSDSDDTVVDNSQPENSHRPEHLRQLPAQFCVDLSSKTEGGESLIIFARMVSTSVSRHHSCDQRMDATILVIILM